MHEEDADDCREKHAASKENPWRKAAFRQENRGRQSYDEIGNPATPICQTTAARVLCGWISEMYLDFDANCPDDGEYDYKPVDQNNDYPMTNSVLPVQVQAAVASA